MSDSDEAPKRRRPLKYCIYGDSGAGKTTMLGTLKNPLIIATDENTLRTELTGKDYFIPISWGALQTKRQELSDLIESGQCPYTAVCIDTITNTEVMGAKGILQLSYIPLDSWNQKFIPQWRDEMLLWCQFSNKARYTNPIDVVFTSRVNYVVAESGERFGTIDAPGKALAKEVYGWMDEVFYIEQQAGWVNNAPVTRHILHTRRFENYQAKDGSGCLEAVEEPDFATIQAKINAKLATLPTRS